MNAGRVDVLAVLDAAEVNAELAHRQIDAIQARKARAALAELIEAAGAYLERNDQWNDDEEPETSEASRSRNEHVRMWKRVNAALARIGAA